MNNTSIHKHQNDGLKATYTAREIFAWRPDTKHYDLLFKVPYTKQTYSPGKGSNTFFTMEHLIESARKEHRYPPIVRPQFIKMKYTDCNGRKLITGATQITESAAKQTTCEAGCIVAATDTEKE